MILMLSMAHLITRNGSFESKSVLKDLTNTGKGEHLSSRRRVTFAQTPPPCKETLFTHW